MALPVERILKSILVLRGEKVILDTDLALLYGVETKVLLQAVRRNIERFPDDFMFQMDELEWSVLKSQFVTSKPGQDPRGGRRTAPYAFTEQGVAMLSSVLRSDRAIAVNIQVMRAFVQLKRMLATHEDLARKIESLERKYDAQFRGVFDAIRELMAPQENPKKQPIGFKVKK
ncbi:MAG: ORF6N domain-containing protein [Holophagaceae bacterium]|nr:ORF6N domain-containing protein [Holophagaceae bacterium]